MYKDKIISQNLNSLSGCNDLNLIINQDWDFPSDSVTLESFKILELIGKGSFGEVYLVELLKIKKLYAMKVLNKSKIVSQNIVRYVLAERNILSNIRHPFITRLYLALQTDEFLYLLLQYCEGKDLNYHLRKSKFFDEDSVRLIMSQLLLAIEELHKNNIIYR